MNDGVPESRKLVREKYAQSYREYDGPRMQNERGRALSEHDLQLFAELYQEALPSPGCKVLEVAAGTGRFTMKALEYAAPVVATDVNDTLLEGLRRRTETVGADRLQVAHEDAFALSFQSESFDLVYAIHFIPRLISWDDQAKAIKEMARVLRPGGSLIVNFRNRRSWLYGRLYERHAVTTDEIEELLAVAALDSHTLHGKHILTRRLLDRVPMASIPLLRWIDWRLRRCCVNRAWDVFLLASKHEER